MFERITAQPLFPSTIWIHEVKPDVAAPLNDRLARTIDRLISPKPPRGPGQTWQTEARLHRLEEFRDLVAIFKAAAKGVLDRLEVDYGEFEITGCWANVNPTGGVHPAHNHPNNYLSGVYYVQVPPGVDAIQFHDPRPHVTLIAPRVKRYNAHNSIVANVRVKPGQLILFPAWLVHSVEANPSEHVRISVSFNVMFPDYVERISYPKWDGIPLPREKVAGR
ncbi:MAG: 2OG-Fe(II) oxygenase family protein [Kiloniellaceae bacterium]